MEVLLAGDLRFFSLSDTGKSVEKLILSGRGTPEDIAAEAVKKNPGRIDLFSFEPQDEGFSRLFQSYDIDCVVYSSSSLDGNSINIQENYEIGLLLDLCVQHSIPRLICLFSDKTVRWTEGKKQQASRMHKDIISLRSTVELCELYADQYELSILITHVPFLFSTKHSACYIDRLLGQIAQKKRAHIPFPAEQSCDFISTEDLNEFVSRALEDREPGVKTIILSGTELLTFGRIASAIRALDPKYVVTLEKASPSWHIPLVSKQRGSRYGWKAKDSLLEHLEGMAYLGNTQGEQRNARRKAAERPETTRRPRVAARAKAVAHTKAVSRPEPSARSETGNPKTLLLTVRNLLVVIALFFAVELLLVPSNSVAEFQYVDFRLLYIVAAGASLGLFPGLAAALLATLSYLHGVEAHGIGWLTLFYNIGNWIPFACYFLVGAVTGYSRNNLISEKKLASQRLEQERASLAIFEKLYQESITHKQQMKQQIINSRDSYGRVFGIAKYLDTMVPEVVLTRALTVLEDMLDNQTIAIYIMNREHGLAHMHSCSRQLRPHLSKSLALDDYQGMFPFLKDGEVWSNTEGLNGYPAFCAPLTSKGEIRAAVMVYRVDPYQMALYYSNKIKLICGFIQDTLNRAVEHNKLLNAQMYLPETGILQNEWFTEVYAAKQEQHEQGIAEHVILRIKSAGNMTEKEVSDRIAQRFYPRDILGRSEDGHLLLVLSQVSEENIDVILAKLEETGLHFERIKDNDRYLENADGYRRKAAWSSLLQEAV